MTQLRSALEGRPTREMRRVAGNEGVEPRLLTERVADGRAVILANANHRRMEPTGIGLGLRTKVNANIGSSPVKSDTAAELAKLEAATGAGADTVMDLSTGSDVDGIRREVVGKCAVPLGTVPIYQAAIEANGPEGLDIDVYLKVLERHARDGVDFATVHAGVTRKAFPLLERRVMRCVSRGGSFLLKWMECNKKENFLHEYFDEVLGIAAKYDIVLSLGDGLRPGCIADATDGAQIQELRILGKLAVRARESGVQVIIEGPGHVPLNEIEKNVQLEKKYCGNAPFFVLGPLPTDIAAGHDHIACAIGGALAGWKGADFLCYVTPKEHMGLPDAGDVREGVIATKIAAHIADIAKGNPGAVSRNLGMARARQKVDWDRMSRYSLDPEKFDMLRQKECLKTPGLRRAKYCSMCGPFCVFRQ